jgi:1-acyl-sn-glycerol-3-phosphate acyltransferase
MIAAIRYVVSLFCFTVYHAFRIIFAALRGVRYAPGGDYDRIPREYARSLLRINHVPVAARGLEQLAEVSACVYVVNHQSWFDVLAVLDVLPGSLRFVAKRELGRVPLFGQALRAAGHIEIDRADLASAVAAYRRAAGRLRRGLSAVVFAEGTRSRTGRLRPFKKGPFVLAIVAQVPVVPVFVEGSYAVLPPGSIRPRPLPITVHLGAPIATDGFGYEDRERLADQARHAMLAMGAREEAG